MFGYNSTEIMVSREEAKHSHTQREMLVEQREVPIFQAERTN